jgi:hypothetical protein
VSGEGRAEIIRRSTPGTAGPGDALDHHGEARLAQVDREAGPRARVA